LIEAFGDSLERIGMPTTEINVKLLRTGEQLLKYDPEVAMLST